MFPASRLKRALFKSPRMTLKRASEINNCDLVTTEQCSYYGQPDSNLTCLSDWILWSVLAKTVFLHVKAIIIVLLA